MSKHSDASNRLCDAAQQLIETIKQLGLPQLDIAELQELKDALDEYERAWDN